MAKITRRTGRTGKTGGALGAVVMGAFAIFGFFFPTPGSDPMMAGFGSPMDGAFEAFKVIWIVVCGAGCIFNLYMAFRGEGISKETIDVDSNGDPLIQISAAPAQSGTEPLDFEDKLRKLKALRDDGLISSVEYEEKRKQVLAEKW